MADLKISELPVATAPTGVELVEIVQGGVNKQTTFSTFSGGSVASVTGQNNAVDNTDTANPIVRNGVREVTGASASVIGDNNGLVIFNSATPFNFTLDQLAQWTKITFINIGAGAVTRVAGAGVTITGNVVLPGATGNYFPADLVIYHTLTTPRIAQGAQAEPIAVTPDTTGATITVDCNGAIQVLAVGSASFATAKDVELTNITNAKVVTMIFNITNVAAVLTFITEDFRAQSADSRFNNTSQAFTALNTGVHEFSCLYDHVADNWKLIITTPYG